MLKGIKKEKKTGAFMLTDSTQGTFRKLHNTFTKVLVLVHFNLKQLIQLKINASGYTIAGILSQLVDMQATSKSLAYWHLIAF